MQDTILGGSGGGGYLLREGESVILPTRLVHIDDEVHADAGVFDPTRYLDGVDEGKNKNKPMKDGKPVPNHSMPWGGGTSMCEGR
jgi:cytochrome P450